MWIVIGPFDEEGEAPPDKSKLLKSGREYRLGRKDQHLQIKHKAISKLHALFTVAECTEEQAADPAFVPALTYHNLTDRVRPVERPSLASPRVLCQGKTSMGLESGDIVHLSASIYVRVLWERVCCYYVPGKGTSHISVKECASIGIHIVPTLHPEVTHHLTPTYSLTPAIATSLISVATLVKPEWLVSILRSAQAETGELSPLEENFVFPPTSKFRPTFAPALPPRLKKYSVWEPNEERPGIFRNHRFIFVGEKGAEAQAALKELVRRGEGDYECFAAEKGKDGLRQVLSKGKARGATIVPVATQDDVVAAVGKEGWQNLVDEARSFEVRFVPPGKLVEAVVCADISYVDAVSGAEDAPQESVLPDVIPNTYEDEPSVVQSNAISGPAAHEPEPEPPSQTAPKRRLPRRATSRASSRAPSPPAAAPEPMPEPVVVEPPPSEQSAPRRTLVRRARAKAVLDNDDSMDLDSNAGRASEEPSASQEPVRKAETSVPPTPSRPSRLKRRVGTQAASVASQLFPVSEDVLIPEAEEPPLKKYRALFDSADPDKISSMNLEEYASQHAGAESITQYEPSVTFATQTGGRTGRTLRTGMSSRTGTGPSGTLGPVVEEEEESATGSMAVSESQTQARGTKRKTQDEDVVMEDEAPPKTRRRTDEEAVGDDESERPPPSKSQKPMSQVVTRVDMAQSQVYVKPKPATKKATQAKAGEPDKDDAFLKAVASTKRGKKTEDTFDRDFNNLKISKPDLEREREDEVFKVLEEFGDDGDVRGNFMVVMEMPLYRETGSRDLLRRGEGRLEWQGRPDFKKFRRKAFGERRQPVELVVEEENDIGIGSQYWKGASQAPPPSQSQSQPKSSTTQKSTQRSGKDRPSLVSDSEEEERTVVKPSKSKASSRSSKPPSTQSKSGGRLRGKGSQKQPLFIDSDIEEEKDGSDEMHMGSNDEGGHRSEEERGGTLKSSTRGTQAKAATTRKKRAPAVVLDDDSDDGATFKAFGARTRTRR